MSTVPDLSLSFLIFFGGLSSICALLLYKSILMSRRQGGATPLVSNALYSWHTPNLKKWKNHLYATLYWIRDISFRYWAVHTLAYVKLLIYRILRATHKWLLGLIKFLERHEDQLKERLTDKSEARSATEQRLIRTLLSRKKYSTQPINKFAQED